MSNLDTKKDIIEYEFINSSKRHEIPASKMFKTSVHMPDLFMCVYSQTEVIELSGGSHNSEKD